MIPTLSLECGQNHVHPRLLRFHPPPTCARDKPRYQTPPGRPSMHTDTWPGKSCAAIGDWPRAEWSQTIRRAVRAHVRSTQTKAPQLTHDNMMQSVVKVGAVAGIHLGLFESGVSVQQCRRPFPDSAVMAVQRSATRVHLCVRWAGATVSIASRTTAATYGIGCQLRNPTFALRLAGRGPIGEFQSTRISASVGKRPPFHLANASISS